MNADTDYLGPPALADDDCLAHYLFAYLSQIANASLSLGRDGYAGSSFISLQSIGDDYNNELHNAQYKLLILVRVFPFAHCFGGEKENSEACGIVPISVEKSAQLNALHD